jgi:hypothetical protein
MRIETALEHSDTVSGTWVMDDGTKCYWSEGRSSTIVCVRPDGEVIDIPCSHIDSYKDQAPELVTILIESIEGGPDPEECRMMTPEEEAEHKAARA